MMLLLLLFSIDISPMVNKANKLYEDEQYEEAYELYRRASILNPENEKIKFNLYDCAYRLKRLREAIDGFSRLTSSENKDLKEKSLYNMGNVFMEARKYREAIQAYRNALLLNPDDERAKRNLEIAREMLKKQKKEDKKEENEEKKEEQKKQQKQPQPQPRKSKMNEALEAEQKKTMKKALKRRTGKEKEEEGKW